MLPFSRIAHTIPRFLHYLFEGKDTIFNLSSSRLHHPWSIKLDQAPVSIGRLQAMTRWRQNDYVADYARVRI